MRITILGASGGTGRELVKQALAGGHEVTAFVRTPAKLTITHPALLVLQGNVSDASAVSNAVAGRDVAWKPTAGSRRNIWPPGVRLDGPSYV